MSGAVRSSLSLFGSEPETDTFRLLALFSGFALIVSFVSIFYHLADVAGGVVPLVAVLLAAFVAATLASRVISERVAIAVGVGLLLVGLSLYLVFVPGLLQEVIAPSFVVDFGVYLTGVSVLQFLRVDLWAIVVSPGPVFVTWYLLLSRRYDLAALSGGLTLGFFTLTTDAGSTVTLLGMLSLFGVLAFGSLERSDGTWKQVEQLTLVALLTLVASRVIGTSGATRTVSGGSGSGPTIESSLIYNDQSISILGSISLSPKVRFEVEADDNDYWRVGAHDRYTGDGWIRTGDSRSYEGPLEGPIGESRTLEQTIEVRSRTGVLPAAWKPVELRGDAADRAVVTALDGFRSGTILENGSEYTVISERPRRSAETLQGAGTDYPDGIAARFLRVPESTPDRVAAKADEIAGSAASPYAAAAAIQRWLGANKGYSLSVNKPGGDIVDGFLFEMEKGYCTYFATAMAVMLRTLDIPARFVTGYTTGEQVDENRWVVRGYNSHAWVEVFFPGAGWIPFDPTPASTRRVTEDRSLQRARGQGVAGVDTEETDPENTATPTDTPLPTVDDEEAPSPPNQSQPGALTLTRPENLRRTPSPGGRTSNFTIPSFTDDAGTTTTGGADSNGGFADGVGRFISERDRVTVLGSVAAIVLGAHQFGALDRFSREMWLRGQEPTDSPRADAERAFERVEFLLGRRYREREPGETPRQYLDDIEVTDRRIRRLAAIYEQAHYAGTVTRADANTAIDLADEIIDD